MFRCLIVAGVTSKRSFDRTVFTISRLEEACRRAARFGTEAVVPHISGQANVSLADMIIETLSELALVADELGHTDDLKFIAKEVKQPSQAVRVAQAWRRYQAERKEEDRDKFYDLITVKCEL